MRTFQEGIVVRARELRGRTPEALGGALRGTGRGCHLVCGDGVLPLAEFVARRLRLPPGSCIPAGRSPGGRRPGAERGRTGRGRVERCGSDQSPGDHLVRRPICGSAPREAELRQTAGGGRAARTPGVSGKIARHCRSVLEDVSMPGALPPRCRMARGNVCRTLRTSCFPGYFTTPLKSIEPAVPTLSPRYPRRLHFAIRSCQASGDVLPSGHVESFQRAGQRA